MDVVGHAANTANEYTAFASEIEDIFIQLFFMVFGYYIFPMVSAYNNMVCKCNVAHMAKIYVMNVKNK